ncbi:hook protein [Proteus mirabilis]|nr:hook protein [Proteus mirabilis]
MQGCKQEIDMTIEQLQEENAKLKQAIISIYTNAEEITVNGEDGYYAVKQDHVNDAYELVDQTE